MNNFEIDYEFYLNQTKDWLLHSRLTPILAILTLVIIVKYYYQFKFSSTRKRLNLHKGPNPLPIIGSLHHLYTCSIDRLFARWQEEFGKIYLFFMGTHPWVVISDVETIKQICIRDFDSFTNHIDQLYGMLDKFTACFLFVTRDQMWRRLRSLLSPTFTSAKVKVMYKLIDESANELVDCIGEQVDDLDSYELEIKPEFNTSDDEKVSSGKRVTFKMKPTFQVYTLSTIMSGMYAMKISRRRGEHTIEAIATRNEFVAELMSVLEFDGWHTFLFKILPEFTHRFLYEKSSVKHFLWVESKFRPVIEERKAKKNSQSKGYSDYLQILVDSKLDGNMELSEADKHESHHATSAELDSNAHSDDQSAKAKNSITPLKAMTDREMIANVVFMIAAGLDTSSFSLEVSTYALAMHQDCQQRLYDELSKIAVSKADGNYEFDYEQLIACEYLDAVICESHRINSPIFWNDRETAKDYTIDKYNVKIPKGTSVFFLLQLVHRDPAYWPEPLKFNPDRFLPHNRNKIVPGTYMPFGQGPRHCVAMRFSLAGTKLALAKIVMKFKFSPRHDNVWPLRFDSFPIYNTPEFVNYDVLVEKR